MRTVDSGTVTASQISHGRENDLEIEIDGTKGSLRWRQENPNELIVRQNGKPHQIYTRDPNAPFMNALGAGACRLPSGHPEAFFEAFANVYAAAFDDMARRAAGESVDRRNTIYPNIYDGVEGMYFIQQCVDSSATGCRLVAAQARRRPTVVTLSGSQTERSVMSPLEACLSRLPTAGAAASDVGCQLIRPNSVTDTIGNSNSTGLNARYSSCTNRL